MTPAPPGASADPGDVGHEGPSFAGASGAVTGEKPESKLWWNDGTWWASMWATAGGGYRIHRLNVSTQAWTNTGTALDPRSNSRADTLWHQASGKLYVASHVYSESGGTDPARLYRYSYNAQTDTYTLDAGFPATINNVRSESLVIDRDSTGQLWATWTQGSQVRVNRTLCNPTCNDATWGTSFVPAVNGAFPNSTSVSSDDISSLISFGNNRIGLMWGNQGHEAWYFAVHTDTAADTTWGASRRVFQGPDEADDHVNLATLLAADDGRIFVAVKTSLNSSSQPAIKVLERIPGSGSWLSHTVSTGQYDQTRPIVLIDESASVLHVFSSDEGGGGIYRKSTPLSNVSFTDGAGTLVMWDDDVREINDVTSTKQNLNSTTGLVVLASNNVTDRYWHHYDPLGGTPPPPTAPVAEFTATPVSGTAPLAVSFTDASTNLPTSWAWDFDSNGTVDSTAQHPQHTYAVGTYTRDADRLQRGRQRSDHEDRPRYRHRGRWRRDPDLHRDRRREGRLRWPEQQLRRHRRPARAQRQQQSVAQLPALQPDRPGRLDHVGQAAPLRHERDRERRRRLRRRQRLDRGRHHVGQRSAHQRHRARHARRGHDRHLGRVGRDRCGQRQRQPGPGDPQLGWLGDLQQPRGRQRPAARGHQRWHAPAARGSGGRVQRHAGQRHRAADGHLHRCLDQRADQLGLGLRQQRLGRLDPQHPQHTYAAGTYTVTLTATNAAGSDPITKTNSSPSPAHPRPGCRLHRDAGQRHRAADGHLHRCLDERADQLGLGLRQQRLGRLDGPASAAHLRRRHLHGHPDRRQRRGHRPDHEDESHQRHRGGGGGTQTFIATADAKVSSSNPNNNYGTAADLRVRNTGDSNAYNSYLRFNLAGLGGSITSAKLRLFVTSGTASGGGAYLVGSGWTEAGITWANAPLISGTALDTRGAVTTGTWVEWDVTAAVSGNGSLNLAIRNSGGSGTYSSREGANDPQLVVTSGG